MSQRIVVLLISLSFAWRGFGQQPGKEPPAGKTPSFQNKPLAFWVGFLKDPDPLVREEGLEVLAALAAEAKEAAPAIRELLNDKVLPVRLKAALLLRRLDPAFAGATPILLDVLHKGTRAQRLYALRVLPEFGPLGEGAAAALMPALLDDDAEVQERARDALLAQGAAAAPLLAKLLDDKDAARRRLALEMLIQLGPLTKAAAPALVARLKDADWATRWEAALALWRMDVSRPDVLPLLVEASLKQTPATRRQALELLTKITPPPKDALPAFVAAMQEPGSSLRMAAAEAVLALEPGHPQLPPALAAVLKDAPTPLKLRALKLLAGMKQTAKVAVADLLALARTADFPLRLAVAELLGDVDEAGPKALGDLLQENHAAAWAGFKRAGAKSVPVLEKMLGHDDAQLRFAALYALEQMSPSPKEALPLLKKALTDKDAHVRRLAVRWAGAWGKAAADLAPALVEDLKGADAETRRLIISALPRLAPDSALVLAALLEAAKDETPAVRVDAANAMRKLSPPAPEGQMLLVQFLADVRTGSYAAQVLHAELPEGPEAVAGLVKSLGTGQSFARGQIVLLLKKMGPASKEAVPALAAALKDTLFGTRMNAAMALLRMDAERAAAETAVLDALRAQRSVSPLLFDDLKALGPKGKFVIPQLRQRLETKPTSDVRYRIMETMVALDPGLLAEVRPLLLAGINLKSMESIYAAIHMLRVDPKSEEALALLQGETQGATRSNIPTLLGAYGAGLKQVSAVLEEMLDDDSPYLRVAAARALWNVDKRADKALPALMAHAADDDPASINATYALGIMGAEGRPAVPLLVDIQRGDRFPNLKRTATEALRTIDPLVHAWLTPKSANK